MANKSSKFSELSLSDLDAAQGGVALATTNLASMHTTHAIASSAFTANHIGGDAFHLPTPADNHYDPHAGFGHEGSYPHAGFGHDGGYPYANSSSHEGGYPNAGAFGPPGSFPSADFGHGTHGFDGAFSNPFGTPVADHSQPQPQPTDTSVYSSSVDHHDAPPAPPVSDHVDTHVDTHVDVAPPVAAPPAPVDTHVDVAPPVAAPPAPVDTHVDVAPPIAAAPAPAPIDACAPPAYAPPVDACAPAPVVEAPPEPVYWSGGGGCG